MDKFKNESELAMHVLENLNEFDKLDAFKLGPLFNIGLRSTELENDSLYWQILSMLTLSHKIIPHTNRVTTLANIAYSVSRLPPHIKIPDQLITELCTRICEINGPINVIDINQLLSFVSFVEKERGMQMSAIWKKYETMLLTTLNE